MISHLKETSKIAEAKYPKEEGQRIVWVFDHSSCHAAMSDETLDVSKMKVNPSLIPRPSTPPVFDRLQYAKTEGEGLGNFIT